LQSEETYIIDNNYNIGKAVNINENNYSIRKFALLITITVQVRKFTSITYNVRKLT
jgi:hypothetical protein